LSNGAPLSVYLVEATMQAIKVVCRVFCCIAKGEQERRRLEKHVKSVEWAFSEVGIEMPSNQISKTP
jgi:hypothetical protein